MQRGLTMLSWGLLLCCWALPASAQLKPKTLRFGLDVDIFSVGGVSTKPDGGPRDHTKVVSFGANELGNSRVTIPSTPLGVSGDMVLRPKWMLGLRGGFGFDHLDADHGRPDVNAFSLSFMPALAYVPTGETIKPFLKAAPIVQFTQLKQSGTGREHLVMGGFSLGAGSFFFLSNRSSVDVGAYFEGRFGQLNGLGPSTQVDDLRGVVRLSVSIWNYRKNRPVLNAIEPRAN